MDAETGRFLPPRRFRHKQEVSFRVLDNYASPGAPKQICRVAFTVIDTIKLISCD